MWGWQKSGVLLSRGGICHPMATGLACTTNKKFPNIAFFKEFELLGKFFKKATKNWKMFCDHALQTHIQSRLRLLHVENLKIILSLQKQLNL